MKAKALRALHGRLRTRHGKAYADKIVAGLRGLVTKVEKIAAADKSDK